MPPDDRERQLSLAGGRTVALYNVPALDPAAHDAPVETGVEVGVEVGGRRRLSLFNVGLACCAVEVAAAAATRPDLQLEPYAAGPGDADALVVSGTVTDAMAPAVLAIYERLAEPRTVISYGACSNSGG